MSSTPSTPSISEGKSDNVLTPVQNGLRALAYNRPQKQIEVSGADVVIYKLSIQDARKVQELSDSLQKTEVDDEKEAIGMELIKAVIRLGTSEGGDMTDEEFDASSMEVLQTIVEKVMEYSGLSAPKEVPQPSSAESS